MPPRTTQLRGFIGSSREGLPIAGAIQTGLDEFAESKVWTQGVISPGTSTLTGLIGAIQQADFAVLVLTPDDLSERVSDPRKVFSPRVNVILELGMSIMALGPERTFIVHSRNCELSFPSDLAGIQVISFAAHSDGNWRGAVGPVCWQIEEALMKRGVTTPQPRTVGERPASPEKNVATVAPGGERDATSMRAAFEVRVMNHADGTRATNLSTDEILVTVGAAFFKHSRGLSDGEIESALARYIERSRYNDVKGTLKLRIHEDDYARIKMHLLSAKVIGEATEQDDNLALWKLTAQGRQRTLEANFRSGAKQPE